MCSFDFVCIVETFVEDFQSDVFHGYNVFSKPAVKFTRQGRHSGGVICLVKNVFVPYVRKLDIECGNWVMLITDKSVFGLPKDVLCVCASVPPEGSPYYNYYDVDNGIGLLEDCLIAWLVLMTFLWYCQVTWIVGFQIFHNTLQLILFLSHYAKAVQRILTGVPKTEYWIIMEKLCWICVLL